MYMSGLLHGLQLAGQLGCPRVIVNCDNMNLIQDMQQGCSRGPAVAVIDECMLLVRHFSKVVFEHCPCEANSVADSLAHDDLSPPEQVWLDDFPAL